MKVTKPIFNQLFVGCLTLFSLCLGRFSAASQELKRPVFHGTIKNNRFDGKPDTLSIGYKKPFTPTGVVTTKILAVADKEGRFSFRLPHFDQPVKILVLIRHKNRSERINDGYLVYPEDSIRMDIVREGLDLKAKFDGRGAEKYNVANALDSLLTACSQKRAEGISANKELKHNLKLLNELVDSHEKEKQSILNRSRLTEKDRKVINYAHGNLFEFWSRIQRGYLELYSDKADQQLIRGNFNALKAKYKYPQDSLMIHAGNYLFNLGWQEAVEVWMSDAPLSAYSERLYMNLKTRYTGMVRERLLANLFLGNTGLLSVFKSSSNSLDSLMEEGEKYMTTPYTKKLYSDKLRLAKGKPVFNASFIDIDGKQIAISDLKGKVVLLDIWANACSWCAIFHEKFHREVWPALKANPNFVYLSINNGDKRESWKLNIGKGIYTSREYLNVSTGALGVAHPFNKHYQIQALPFMLLIDKDGKIFENKGNNMDELKRSIKELLAH